LSDYEFPEIFVKGVESERGICLEDSSYRLVKSREEECVEYYGSIPYEEVLNYIDLEKALLRNSIILVNPKTRPKALLFQENTRLCLQEIKGRAVFYTGSQEYVRRGELIAHVATSKNEVRNTYSLCEGFLLAIIDLTWEKPERVIVVTALEQPREITIR